MDVTSAKIIRIILLIIACIVLPFGIVRAAEIQETNAAIERYEKRIADHKIENVCAELAEVKSDYKERSKIVVFTYSITNNTSVTINEMTIITEIFNDCGEIMGSITAEFGKYEDFKIAPGETVEHTGQWFNDSTDFFEKLYLTGLRNRTQSTTITEVHWTDGMVDYN